MKGCKEGRGQGGERELGAQTFGPKAKVQARIYFINSDCLFLFFSFFFRAFADIPQFSYNSPARHPITDT